VFELLSWKLEAGSSKLENKNNAMAAFKAQDQGARILQSEAYFLYAAAKAV
jgi:hypothetical protein